MDIIVLLMKEDYEDMEKGLKYFNVIFEARGTSDYGVFVCA